MRGNYTILILWVLPLLSSCDREAQPKESAPQAEAASARTESSPQMSASASVEKEKIQSGSTDGQGQEAVNNQQVAQFNQDYEMWKKRAVDEFPDLGKAGSAFNQQFLSEAKRLRDQNAPELTHPNWPYLLALQVNTSYERNKALSLSQTNANSESPGETGSGNRARSTVQGAPNSTSSQKDSERFGTYTIAELARMSPLPRGGVFKGTITRVEKQIAAGDLDIVVVLDGILTCEVNLDRNTSAQRTSSGFYPLSYYYGSGTNSRRTSSLEIVQEQNSLKLVQRTTASNSYSYTTSSGRVVSRGGSHSDREELLTLRVGQTVDVEGVLLVKANKKPFVKGIIKPD